LPNDREVYQIIYSLGLAPFLSPERLAFANLVPEVTAKLKGQLVDPGMRLALVKSESSTDQKAKGEKIAAELNKGLARATTAQQASLLKQARDAKDPVYIRALALVIPQLRFVASQSPRSAGGKVKPFESG
jgi:hypothetical protein